MTVITIDQGGREEKTWPTHGDRIIVRKTNIRYGVAVYGIWTICLKILRFTHYFVKTRLVHKSQINHATRGTIIMETIGNKI